MTDPEEWVDRHGDCLYRYAMLRLRRPELAADLVQETFLEALRARHSFGGRSSERTWLIGILRHKVIDHLRRACREHPIDDLDALGISDDPGFTPRGFWKDGPAAWRGDPVRDLERREFWETLSRCLSRLPRNLADAFFLAELDGLPSDEIQKTLRITPANLWARLCRARSLLRACLERHWFGPRASPR